MSVSGISKFDRRGEAAETSLARNLVAARICLGLTQEALASASGISRATIAQLESGVSDPRLSTVAAIAAAMGLPTSLLMLSDIEMRSLVDLLGSQVLNLSPLPATDLRLLQQWADSSMLRDRNEAVRLVNRWMNENGRAGTLAAVLAGLFAGVLPEWGLSVGAKWGDLMAAELRQLPSEV